MTPRELIRGRSPNSERIRGRALPENSTKRGRALSPPLEEGWLREAQTGWSGFAKSFGVLTTPAFGHPSSRGGDNARPRFVEFSGKARPRILSEFGDRPRISSTFPSWRPWRLGGLLPSRSIGMTLLDQFLQVFQLRLQFLGDRVRVASRFQNMRSDEDDQFRPRVTISRIAE